MRVSGPNGLAFPAVGRAVCFLPLATISFRALAAARPLLGPFTFEVCGFLTGEVPFFLPSAVTLFLTGVIRCFRETLGNIFLTGAVTAFLTFTVLALLISIWRGADGVRLTSSDRQFRAIVAA